MRLLPMLATLAAVSAGVPAMAAEQVFPADGFTAVVNATAGDLDIRVGRPFRVVATGDAARLARLRVEVRGDTLVIEQRGGGWRGGRLALLVELPALASVSMTGAGDGRVDAVTGATFRAATTGSGDLAIGRLAVREARLTSTGAGDLTATGTVERLEATTTGTGDLLLSGLAAATVVARSTGAGDIGVGPADSAEARTSGVGDISIAGTPRCRTSSSGIGTIRCG